MNRSELKLILNQIKRTQYLSTIYLLKKNYDKFSLVVDSDTVRFIKSNYMLKINDIYGVLVDNNILYILTKKKHLHRIDSSGFEHIIFDANYSFYDKIKKCLNHFYI